MAVSWRAVRLTSMTVQKSDFLTVLPWIRLSKRSRSGIFLTMPSNATAKLELASRSSTASRLLGKERQWDPRVKADASPPTGR